MTKRVSEILYEMAAEEGFYFLDIERFCKKNKDEIQKLNTIFDTNDDRNDEIMDVAHYLISKTFDNFENYENYRFNKYRFYRFKCKSRKQRRTYKKSS